MSLSELQGAPTSLALLLVTSLTSCGGGSSMDDAPAGASSSGASAGDEEMNPSSSGEPTDSSTTDAATSSSGDEGSSGMDGANETGGIDGVPMFVAQGHMGRTLISCDDGRSWVADMSNDDTVRCFDPYDCDHDAGAGRGVTWGDGTFLVTFGWGTPGGLFASRDGVAWEPVLEGTTFSGVAFGGGIFLAGSTQPQVSIDGGATWQPSESPNFQASHVRRVGYVPHEDGRFLLVGDSAISMSSNGTSWTTPTTLPEGCGTEVQTTGGIAYGNGTILVLGRDGQACSSSDGGATFESHQLGTQVSSHLVFDGDAFLVWSQGTRWSSEDGVSWSSDSTEPAGLQLGPVAIGDTGTIVGVRGGWQVWYEEQEFYRSTDGIQWEVLPPDSFSGGHPIRAITYGYGDPSSVCPE